MTRCYYWNTMPCNLDVVDHRTNCESLKTSFGWAPASLRIATTSVTLKKQLFCRSQYIVWQNACSCIFLIVAFNKIGWLIHSYCIQRTGKSSLLYSDVCCSVNPTTTWNCFLLVVVASCFLLLQVPVASDRWWRWSDTRVGREGTEPCWSYNSGLRLLRWDENWLPLLRRSRVVWEGLTRSWSQSHQTGQ